MTIGSNKYEDQLKIADDKRREEAKEEAARSEASKKQAIEDFNSKAKPLIDYFMPELKKFEAALRGRQIEIKVNDGTEFYSQNRAADPYIEFLACRIGMERSITPKIRVSVSYLQGGLKVLTAFDQNGRSAETDLAGEIGVSSLTKESSEKIIMFLISKYRLS